ncbi:MAG: 30S ribosomal protein S3 [Anaerolineae bacterium]|nr:30S ribosomal protein S3 [Anaerolineae bacterium]
MGRKVDPRGFRLGYIRDWDSKWFAEGRDYVAFINEDADIRDMIHGEMPRSGIARITIERYARAISIGIHTSRPGVVIGRRGSNINALKAKVTELTGLEPSKVRLDVVEVENPDLSAPVVAEGIAEQLERRISPRRAMRRAIQSAMRAGAEGVRIECKGRLSGSEMGRREWHLEGRVPLHTLRANVDFARGEAKTTYGMIGVKVWINQGEVFADAEKAGERNP